jgi:hypothetical protein
MGGIHGWGAEEAQSLANKSFIRQLWLILNLTPRNPRVWLIHIPLENEYIPFARVACRNKAEGFTRYPALEPPSCHYLSPLPLQKPQQSANYNCDYVHRNAQR